jgi:hypothetical protein
LEASKPYAEESVKRQLGPWRANGEISPELDAVGADGVSDDKISP